LKGTNPQYLVRYWNSHVLAIGRHCARGTDSSQLAAIVVLHPSSMLLHLKDPWKALSLLLVIKWQLVTSSFNEMWLS
jgi:hypothetical protein